MVVKAGVYMVMIDGHHLQHTIKLLHEEGGFSSTGYRFHVHLAIQTVGAAIKAVEAIKLGQVPKRSAATKCRDVPCGYVEGAHQLSGRPLSAVWSSVRERSNQGHR